MEQNREYKIDPTCGIHLDFKQKCQSNSFGKEIFLQQMVLNQLDNLDENKKES
jgi:hypothetical protein